jgi:hypothetical protein
MLPVQPPLFGDWDSYARLTGGGLRIDVDFFISI